MSSSVHFIKNGNTYSVAPKGSIEIEKTLPPKTFSLKSDPNRGFYLEEVASFTLPAKVYGDTLKLTDRILHTFSNRENSTGVLLVGEKGSGKTLLARGLSITGATRGVPTIVVNSPFVGDQFNSLIQAIDQPCILLFDEFEKTYDKESQEKILTLLDGVFQSKKLFVLTSNDKYRIDANMRNRPGRIFYLLDFKGLDEGFIREYCDDNLINKSHLDELIKVSGLFDVFNFDLLAAFVEELNRYDESPINLLPLLNAKPEYCSGSDYEIKSMTFRDIHIPLSMLDKHVLISRNFNLSSDEWVLMVSLEIDPSSIALEEMFSNATDEFDYSSDLLYDGIKEGKVKIVPRSSRSKISMARFRNRDILSLGFDDDSQEDDDSDKKVIHGISVIWDQSDITQYTSGGANYKNEDGFKIEVRKSRTKRTKADSIIY